MTIHKSATKIGTVVNREGCRIDYFASANHNTGEPILWMHREEDRVRRFTGRNLEKMLDLLNDMLNEGELSWHELLSSAALSGLARAAGRSDLFA